MEEEISNKRIAKNTIFLYIRMILVLAVSLYTSREILSILGVVDFGIYNVVAGSITLLGFFNGAMASATQRFLSFEIGQKNIARLFQVFNATVVIHIAISIGVFVIAETVGLFLLKKYMVIPQERYDASIWVYHMSILAFMSSVILVPFNALIISFERMQTFAYISIVDVCLKLLIVYLVSHFGEDKLITYSVLYLIAGLLILVFTIIYVVKVLNVPRFRFVKDIRLYKSLVTYSGWSLFGGIAAVLQNQGINVLLNIFHGPVVNASRAIVVQVQGAVRNLVTNLHLAANPQIVKSYSANDLNNYFSIIFTISKFSFFLLLLISLPIILEPEVVLTIWLGIVPDYAGFFLTLILIDSLVTCVSGPLLVAVQAIGKIKLYQIVVGSLLIFSFPISYLFLSLGYEPYIVFYVNIFIECIALIFRIFFLKKLINFSIVRFLNEVIGRIFLVTIIALPVPIFLSSLHMTDYFRLGLVSLATLIIVPCVIYIFGLRKRERLKIRLYIQRKFLNDRNNL